MSAIVSATTAVVTALNTWTAGQTYSAIGTWTAVRSYEVEYELKDMQVGKVKVDVVAGTTAQFPYRGNNTEEDYQVSIGIHVKVADSSTTTIDPYMDFVEKMSDFLREHKTFGSAKWLRCEYTVLYSPTGLKEARIFKAILVATLKGMRTQ